MKINPLFKRAGGIIILFAFQVGIIALSFFLAAFVYEKIGWYPSVLGAQLITSSLGLFFTIFILFILGSIFRSRRVELQMGVFGTIITALERIARGDFNARVEEDPNGHFQENEIVGKLVKSVNDMAVELSLVEKMRQEFISDVSHEIQSPLTSIRGFARALHNVDLTPDDRLHYINIIESESTRLSKLSENLLQLASLDSDGVKVEPKLYRLDRQIKNLIVACEPQWMEKEIDMDVSLEKVNITADEDLLSQVWINLIHNGIKFTPQCGRISIGLHQRSGNIQFSIADTGIGISEEDRPHVFGRFFKADKSRQRSNGGSGLGLSIAKKIIEMHQGTIEVYSELGAGTTIIVTIPSVL